MVSLPGGDPRLDFRMAGGEREDAWFRGHAARITARVVEGLGPARIRALVISGSAARGEAGVLLDGERAFPVADLDLYAVARDAAEKAAVDEARHRVLRELAAEPIKTDVGVIEPGDLARLPPTIANRTLLREGRVVWGDARVLEGAAPIADAAIPREDALLLVANRAAEELAAIALAARRPGEREAALEAFYRGVKTTTDLGLAVLMMRGRFESGYEGRGDRVRQEIERDRVLAEALPPGFAGAVAGASDWKRAPALEGVAGRVPGTGDYPRAAERDLAERIGAVRGFLAWYAGEAGDPLGALERSERIARAARSWVRYARRGVREAATAASRLATGRARPSPRFAVQLAALHLYLGAAGEGGGGEAARALRLLPGGPRAADRRDAVDGAVRAWGREVMNWMTT